MNLWYIAIDIDHWLFDRDYDSEFGYRTRFVSNYLSKQIRKAKFKTDGTFRMICVRLWPKTEEKIFLDTDCLMVLLPFDKERYEQIKGTQNCEYYLEVLEEGFRKAATLKKIPLETLLGLIDEFRKDGCKNEWLHRRKRFKEYDIEVALNCYFTTLDFKLVATIKRISTKEELCSDIVLQTEPDEIHFDHLFKDLLIDGNNIIITDYLDRPRYLIDLEKAVNKEFVLSLIPSGIDNDEGDDG